jgi:hypothetical protein
MFQNVRERSGLLDTTHSNHPAPAELHRFLRGEASREEAKAIVRHLLAGCPECVVVTRPVWQLAEHRIEPLPLYKKKGSSRLRRMEAIR